MSIERVVVLGAGTMGHGIAQIAAQAGCRTVLFDVDAAVVAGGLAKIAADLEKGVARGKVEAADRDAILSRLEAADGDLAAAVSGADLVVEAVPERLDLKCSIFESLGRSAPETAILATNTSSLPITRIASASGCAERVVGMHFFNPVPRSALLELVHTDATSAETIETLRTFGERMGKTVIVVKDSPGFATTRLGVVLALEAMRMVEEGVGSAEDVDKAMELGYRHPMGPLKVTDLVGLDVRLGIAEHLAEALPGGRFEVPDILRRLVREGKLGKKSGQGFYDWSES